MQQGTSIRSTLMERMPLLAMMSANLRTYSLVSSNLGQPISTTLSLANSLWKIGEAAAAQSAATRTSGQVTSSRAFSKRYSVASEEFGQGAIKDDEFLPD